jgi:hypothetical protein
VVQFRYSGGLSTYRRVPNLDGCLTQSCGPALRDKKYKMSRIRDGPPKYQGSIPGSAKFFYSFSKASRSTEETKAVNKYVFRR